MPRFALLRFRRPVTLALALRLALVGSTLAAEARTGVYEEGRAASGARLFRAMVAADTEIETRKGADGALHLLVVHLDDDERARSLAEVIARRDATRTPEPLRGLAVQVDVIPIAELATRGRGAAGVFVAQPLNKEQVLGLVRFAIERRVLVYSPYEGDVERGVPGGLSVEAQVRPMVNTRTLHDAGIVLKAFFLKVAKAYP